MSPCEGDPDGWCEQLDPIEVNKCQYGGEYPYCNQAPPPPPPSGDSPPPPDGGGPSPGGDDPCTKCEPDGPPPPEEEQPCETGDPVVDAPEVQAAFEQIWAQSNPDATQSKRIEQGGWIVHDGSSYSFEPFPNTIVQGPCSIRLVGVSIPPNAVAWVHTHPYRSGEVQYSCEVARDGSYYVYQTGRAARADVAASKRIEALKPGAGRGYTLDRNGITQFSAKTRPGSKDNWYKRCGY